MEGKSVSVEPEKESLNFLEQMVEQDIAENVNGGDIVTRFPPEPNGQLHIGHAKALCVSYGLADKYKGKYNLRFDDTNPEKEDTEFVEAIKEDIKWLGFDWEDREYFTSDYFDQLYDWAIEIIKKGNAYVCEQSAEEISVSRGTPSTPATPSPWRERPVEESLDLFEKMKNGQVEEGSMVLRAKIDLASPNMHMRDPIMYRIKKEPHHKTGTKWNIYPSYDFAHGQSDYIEGITHSLCSLEFEVHRPLYEWFLDQVYREGTTRPKQREFARLNLNYTVMSKRLLTRLVDEGHVAGWDDPRMPTLSGMRRRGYTPAAIKNFLDKAGVAKRENIIDLSLLEFCVREDLNKITQRIMGVLDPLKVVITNYPEGQDEMLDAVNNPEDESKGIRQVPFSRELYIEQADFMEDAPKKFFRLAPGREVRLRYAYYITCNEVIKDESGNVIQLNCTYDPETKGGQSADGRKVKGTLHWVSVEHAIKTEVRLYDRLFKVENPLDIDEGQDFTTNINENSLEVIEGYIEPYVQKGKAGDLYQFERLGYFALDTDSNENKVFNRTSTLRDSWSQKKK